jgi:hypothetical protein
VILKQGIIEENIQRRREDGNKGLEKTEREREREREQ